MNWGDRMWSWYFTSSLVLKVSHGPGTDDPGPHQNSEFPLGVKETLRKHLICHWLISLPGCIYPTALQHVLLLAYHICIKYGFPLSVHALSISPSPPSLRNVISFIISSALDNIIIMKRLHHQCLDSTGGVTLAKCRHPSAIIPPCWVQIQSIKYVFIPHSFTWKTYYKSRLAISCKRLKSTKTAMLHRCCLHFSHVITMACYCLSQAMSLSTRFLSNHRSNLSPLYPSPPTEKKIWGKGNGKTKCIVQWEERDGAWWLYGNAEGNGRLTEARQGRLMLRREKHGDNEGKSH